MQTVLIIQGWGVGDMVMTLPVVYSFKEHGYTLYFLVRNKSVKDFIKYLIPDCNVLFIPNNFSNVISLIIRVWSLRFKYVFISAGHCSLYYFLAKNLLQSEQILFWPPQKKSQSEKHQVILNIDLLKKKYRTIKKSRVSIYNFGTWKKSKSEKQDVILIHPGSSSDTYTKRLPLKLIHILLYHKFDKFQKKILIGPNDTDLVCKFKNYPKNIFVYSNSIFELAEIFERTKVIITGDTGIGHLGCFFDIYTIGIFGPTSAKTTAPFSAKFKKIERSPKLKCQPCKGSSFYYNCPFGIKCMNDIDKQIILREVKNVLCR